MVGHRHARSSRRVRRRCLIAAVIGASSVGSLFADAPAAAPELRTVARPAPFVGILADPYGSGTRVGCFDSLSLRPISAPAFLGEYHDAWSTSPDGTRVALGISAPGSEARIGVRIVNLARWATELDVETGIAAEAVAWLTDRTLVAALQRGGIVLIDPIAGEVVGRWAGWRALDAVSTRTRRRFVLLEPGGRTRRLATVDTTGRLLSVSLRLPLRSRHSRLARPALVADPVREHAYVLTGGRVVVDVDLQRMRVRRRLLQPALELGAARGRFPVRGGLWLGDDRLAVSGYDAVPGRGLRRRTYPAGLSTIDTKTWNVGVVDSAANGATLAPGRLLAYGDRGVRGYSRAGRRVFEALRKEKVWSVGAAGRLAYAVSPTATHVIDARSGRIRRKISRSRELSGVIARRCPTGSG
jgi:hypothetical protein